MGSLTDLFFVTFCGLFRGICRRSINIYLYFHVHKLYCMATQTIQTKIITLLINTRFSIINEELSKVNFWLNSISGIIVFPFFAGKLRKQSILISCKRKSLRYWKETKFYWPWLRMLTLGHFASILPNIFWYIHVHCNQTQSQIHFLLHLTYIIDTSFDFLGFSAVHNVCQFQFSNHDFHILALLQFVGVVQF